MKLNIQHQERYSRGELLLRTFFGLFYIYIPHAFILMFMGFWGAILQFVAFWVILFTGQYPETMFEYQVGLINWEIRLLARMCNLSDGYPVFGIKSTDEHTDLVVPYPEKVNQSLTLVRLLFGVIYVVLPHRIILNLRAIFVIILMICAWWVVLVTARYPRSMHQWIVGQLRWELRVVMYLMYMTDTYPAFTGDELPDEG